MFHRGNYLAAIATSLMLVVLGQLLMADDVVIKSDSTPLAVLKDGKVHEAFITAENYYTDAPLAAPKMPRADLVEAKPAIPSELEKRAVWIPGYWEWKADTEEFIWITGVWRFPPPGRRWIDGKWTRTDDGFVRVRGHWIPAKVETVAYVAAPPRYQGTFPLATSLAKDQLWVPGCWIPAEEGKFTWREGFVAESSDNWVWVPAQYSWTPKGWILIDGYWDYPLASRGQAFAALKLGDGNYEADKIRVETFAPIPNDAITESASCEYVYSLKNVEEDFEFISVDVNRDVPEAPVAVTTVLPARPEATIRGIVHRGALTPVNIEVELIGHTVTIATTDDQGRFEFSNVPYGIYYVRAQGPVQNHIKQARGKITVAEPVVDAIVELN